MGFLSSLPPMVTLLLISLATLLSIEPGFVTPHPKIKANIAPPANKTRHLFIRSPLSRILQPNNRTSPGRSSSRVTLIPPLDEASPQTRIRAGVAAGALHRNLAAAAGPRSRHPA